MITVYYFNIIRETLPGEQTKAGEFQHGQQTEMY